jgi:2-isopropylmalate synthase
MDPAAIGHESKLVLGKHSGRAAFQDALAKMGLSLEDVDFQNSFDRFKELADRKGEITEEGIRAIVSQETGTDLEEMHFKAIHVSGGSDEVPVATVTLSRSGEDVVKTAEGDGMVNATFVAVQDAYNIPARLLDYRVSPITSGADAMAEVSVIIKVGSSTYSGRGVSTDVVEGSARAMVSAMNKAAFDRGVIETSGDPEA